MAGQDNMVYKTFYDTPQIQDRLRLYAQNKEVFKLLALREVDPLSILTVISEKFGTIGADMLSDWQFRYQEFDELPFKFTLTEASVRPVSGSLIDYVKLTNRDAAALITGHRLVSSGTFMGIDLSGGVTTTNCADSFNVNSRPLNEIIRVLDIGSKDSAFEGNAAATGYTWVKVKRAHPGTSVTGQLAAIPSGSTLTISNSVAKTNQRPFPPIAANGRVLYNAIQLTRESYGVGEHLTQGGGLETLLMSGGQAYLNLNYELCEKSLMKKIERAIITGRRTLQELDTESEYETGGILEFIPTENYINMGGIITEARMNLVLSQIFEKSGLRELYMFGTSTFTRLLADAYTGKRIFGVEQNLSLNYGMRVYSLESTGRDGIIYYINAPVLDQTIPQGQALVLNLTEQNFDEKSKYGCFQIAEKVPIDDYPKEEATYESNAGFKGTWRELYGAWGLVRRMPETHFRIYGVTI